MFLLGPSLLRLAGMNGLLALLVVLCGVALAFTPLLPARGKTATAQGVSKELFRPTTLFALVGFGLFFLNAGAYWTYVQIVGEAAGFSPRLAANCVAGGISGGILGGAVAWMLGDRFGRLWPLLLSCLMTVGAAILLRAAFGVVVFVLSVLLYFFAWNYSVAYQLSIVSAVDATGRGVALTQVFVFLGAAAGAGIAAFFISPGHYEAVSWVASIGVCLSTASFVAALGVYKYGQRRGTVLNVVG
jgi:hypothetical protein